MKKVINARISQGNKNSERGCTIEFNSTENIVLGSIVTLTHNERSHDFEVNKISINVDNSLAISANEVGYWGSKFDNKKDFDLRTIIGLDIEVIVDEEVIKKIRQSSQYC